MKSRIGGDNDACVTKSLFHADRRRALPAGENGDVTFAKRCRIG
jgi:hypothetical protein